MDCCKLVIPFELSCTNTQKATTTATLLRESHSTPGLQIDTQNIYPYFTGCQSFSTAQRQFWGCGPHCGQTRPLCEPSRGHLATASLSSAPSSSRQTTLTSRGKFAVTYVVNILATQYKIMNVFLSLWYNKNLLAIRISKAP